ncbi:long-chain fatty acid transport protein [Desulfacinum infernum DSM 9756]|uniref:Long-chain fatty acid transport protein n=1 Tax=Desulfacinum infernum DSM 9756 TaxID=1121391 RepID=A0A1M5EA09_9BACT|nr:porin [Desulfacinum infernum]SHF76079.1 long-chain fatty acid transport protein [Desulfacinum infernum DSM 9756]
MKRTFSIVFLLFLLGALAAPPAQATNGDNLIAVGPVSRAMGGVGVAAPQDAIGAVFVNPAAMCFGPYCPASEVNFGGTLFMPKVDTKISFPNTPSANVSSDGEEKVYPIPAIGLSVPLTDKPPFWRFGLSAYGVSGLGVDYKGKAVDRGNPYFGGYPYASGVYTELAIMKFAPAIAFQPFEKLSFGAALHVDYATLDLRAGSSTGYGLGVQLGAIYKASDTWSFGLSYTSPQNVNHDDVADFDQDGTLDRLKLESPHQVAFGVAYQPTNKFLVEADVKWLNWSNANGYEDFDWNDQWVFAVGAQYKVHPKLTLRVGYNYAENPVKEHNGFNGQEVVSVQGKSMMKYYYETFRIVGFPAVVEHHVTFGVGYDFSPRFSVHAGYVHAFEKTIKESGTDITGQPVNLESSLSENSLDFGFTWRF